MNLSFVRVAEFFSYATFLETAGSSQSGLRNADPEGVSERRVPSQSRPRSSRVRRALRRFIRKFKKVARFTRCKTPRHPLHPAARVSFSLSGSLILAPSRAPKSRSFTRSLLSTLGRVQRAFHPASPVSPTPLRFRYSRSKLPEALEPV